MLNEETLKQYDEYLVDRESRAMKGTLTNEEKQEDAALAADKAFVADFFSKHAAEV